MDRQRSTRLICGHLLQADHEGVRSISSFSSPSDLNTDPLSHPPSSDCPYQQSSLQSFPPSTHSIPSLSSSVTVDAFCNECSALSRSAYWTKVRQWDWEQEQEPEWNNKFGVRTYEGAIRDRGRWNPPNGYAEGVTVGFGPYTESRGRGEWIFDTGAPRIPAAAAAAPAAAAAAATVANYDSGRWTEAEAHCRNARGDPNDQQHQHQLQLQQWNQAHPKTPSPTAPTSQNTPLRDRNRRSLPWEEAVQLALDETAARASGHVVSNETKRDTLDRRERRDKKLKKSREPARSWDF